MAGGIFAAFFSAWVTAVRFGVPFALLRLTYKPRPGSTLLLLLCCSLAAADYIYIYICWAAICNMFKAPYVIKTADLTSEQQIDAFY